MNDTKLETYLNSLNKALEGIAVSERAEIVTEIKSHILSAVEKDPSIKLESVLSSLGEPEQVASRYLLERGLKPHKYKVPFVPIIKWLVVGFLGTLIILILLSGFLAWKLKPSFGYDGKIGNIELLDGAVKIRFSTDDNNIINLQTDNLTCNQYQITLQSTPDDLKTHCSVIEMETDLKPTGTEKEVTFNADNGSRIECEFLNDQLQKCKIDN